MESVLNRRFVVAVLTVTSLMIVLSTVAPIRSGSPSAREYDPWLDWNDDSKIDMRDISRVALAFGRGGLNVSKASLAYDSGWLDLRNETTEYYTIIHNLNDTELQVDACEYKSGWNRTYGGTSGDEVYALVQTGDGGYALAGCTSSFGAGGTDAWLVKTDEVGNMQWNKTYGGTNDDYVFDLVQTSDGGYALAGETLSSGVFGEVFWLVKTDASGNEQWNQTYRETAWAKAEALVQTSDGGYALAGCAGWFDVGWNDFWLVKTDASGNAQWNQNYGRARDDKAYALVQTNDGGYAIAGQTGSFDIGSYDFWLVKTDVAGNMQWNKTYGGTNDDYVFDLVQTSDGGYAIAGCGFANLVKTDADGTMQWNTNYESMTAYALVQTNDGGYSLAGLTWSSASSNDAWLVKTDSAGTMMWNKTYGGTNSDVAQALVQTSDGGYAIAGYTNSFGAGNGDFWLVKTDSIGNVDGGEYGLAWTYSSVNTIALYRGATDTSWNYVRVRLWKPR
jgi:hypothetical protein